MNGWDILCLIVGIIWIGTMFVGIFELSRMPKRKPLHKEEYVKKSDIINMYESDFPDLDDGVHWSRCDIISNLDAIPTYNIAQVEHPDNWKKNVHMVIHSILTSYGYNRSEEYMIDLCKEIINRLDGTCIENCRHYCPSMDKDIVEDCNIIYGALVCAFGDYGTSPRYGWIDDKIAVYCVGLLNAEIKEKKMVIKMRGEE